MSLRRRGSINCGKRGRAPRGLGEAHARVEDVVEDLVDDRDGIVRQLLQEIDVRVRVKAIDVRGRCRLPRRRGGRRAALAHAKLLRQFVGFDQIVRHPERIKKGRRRRA